MASARDYRLGSFDFARGWYVVANSCDISTTKPHNARYFGEDVVLFRGAGGKVGMVAAYCPHMGTHMGKSRNSYLAKAGINIQEDGIRCPFHGWRFGLDGTCNHIPYYSGAIPRAARVKAWHVEERYGIVFCWNDPEGLEPHFDLPTIPEWDDDAVVRWDGLHLLGDLPCHPIEIFDNNSDYAHLAYLHGSNVLSYENEIDGLFYRQRQSSFITREDIGAEWARPAAFAAGDDPQQLQASAAKDLVEVSDSGIVKTTNAYYGVGMNVAQWSDPVAVQLIATTPVDDGSCRVWQGAIVRSPDGVVDDAARSAAAMFNSGLNQALGVDDGEIWANKRPATTILQLPSDGPFGQARVWYSQFFNPRSEAAAIVDRVQGVYRIKGVAAFDAAI